MRWGNSSITTNPIRFPRSKVPFRPRLCRSLGLPVAPGIEVRLARALHQHTKTARSHHTVGGSRASLGQPRQEAISKLPETSVIEWWFEENYRFTLPPAGIIQRIRWLAARRHFDLQFTNAGHATA